MVRFYEKNRYLALVIAAFYVYVTFTIHLHHTCHLGVKPQHSQNPNQTHCCLIGHNQPFCLEQSKDWLTCPNKTHKSKSDVCIACLYSASANATNFFATITPSFFAPPAVSEIKPKETVIQKTQDFTPILLRAPPTYTS